MRNCKYCGAVLKGSRRKFCSNKHKDKFHNETNPRGIFAHLKRDVEWEDC